MEVIARSVADLRDETRPRLCSDPGIRKETEIGRRTRMLGTDFSLKYQEKKPAKAREKAKKKEGGTEKDIKFMKNWIRSASVGSNTLTDGQTDTLKSRDDIGIGKLGAETRQDDMVPGDKNTFN